jgi:hypothetical protein
MMAHFDEENASSAAVGICYWNGETLPALDSTMAAFI